MLYQFDAEGAGTVIAEDKLGSLTPYVELHYLQNFSQAKELYTSIYFG